MIEGHNTIEVQALNEVVVFNPTNPDSVISATMLASGKGIKAVSYRNAIEGYDTYHMVGVDNLVVKGKTILYTYYPHSKEGNYSKIFSLADVCGDDLIAEVPKSLLMVVVKQLSFDIDNYWMVSSFIASFMEAVKVNNHNNSIEAQATVWVNYNSALEYLEGADYLKEPFSVQTQVSENDIREYMFFMKSMKTRIQRAWHLTEVTIVNKAYHIPVVSLETDAVAFGVKFIANAFDRVIVTEVRGAVFTCNIFTRHGDYADISKVIKGSQHNTVVVKWYS